MAKVKEVKKEEKQIKSIILDFSYWYKLKSYAHENNMTIRDCIHKAIDKFCK